MNFTDVLGSVSECQDIGWVAASHMWHAFRDLCEHPSAARGDKFFRLNTGEPHPFANFVLLSDLGDPDLAKECVAPLVETPAPSAVIFVTQQNGGPAIAAIEDRGYAHFEQMPAMAVDIEALADTTLPSGYEFMRVSQNDRHDWLDCLAVGYEIPKQTAETFIPETLGTGPDDATQYFAVRHDNAMVAVSMLYMNHGVAGIYCVATLPEHRGKGLGAYATAEPLRIAQRLGYGVGVLQSSEMGHSVYKGLGFRDVGGLPLYVRMP
jgi:GNAT superfamily N-acetyltransferase